MLERYHCELLNFLSRQVSDRDTAADLAQESFVRVLDAHSCGQAVLEMRALLYRTAGNLDSAAPRHRPVGLQSGLHIHANRCWSHAMRSMR